MQLVAGRVVHQFDFSALKDLSAFSLRSVGVSLAALADLPSGSPLLASSVALESGAILDPFD